MKVSELKKIIKPLIKECLKEVLVEEGLTKMLQESLKNTQPVVAEVSSPLPVRQQKLEQEQKQEEKKQTLQENKKRMLDAIGKSGFDAFAGTAPLDEAEAQAASNPGVDISSLMGNKNVWKETLAAMDKFKK